MPKTDRKRPRPASVTAWTSFASCSAFRNVDAGAVQVLDRAQLHIEEVSDAAMRVCRVADAVELEVRVAETGIGRRLREFRTLRELDAIGRRLHAVVADLARIAHRIQEVG